MEINLASTHRRTRLLAAGIASALMAYAATAVAAEHVKTLVSFTGPPDVFLPSAGLVVGPDGNFYGTSFYGGLEERWMASGPTGRCFWREMG